MEAEQSLCSTEVLEIKEEEEEYCDVKSSLKHAEKNAELKQSLAAITKASKVNLEDGLKGAHGDGSGSGGALIKPSRSLEARRSSIIAPVNTCKGHDKVNRAHRAAAPTMLPNSQYPKCPEPMNWRKGSKQSFLSTSTTKWICNILQVEHPLTKSVRIQLEVYDDATLASKRVVMLSKNGNVAQLNGSAWIRDNLKLTKNMTLLELVYLNRQTVVAYGPYKGQTVHRFQIKKVADAVAEQVADSVESEMELSSDEEQEEEEEEGGGPSDAALQLKSPRPFVVKLGVKHNTASVSPDITKWIAGVAKVPYPLEDSLCIQLEAYDGNQLLGEKSVLLSKCDNGGNLGGCPWLIEMLKLRKGDNGINLTYLGRKKVIHYYKGCHPQKRLSYRFRVDKATSNDQKRRRASYDEPGAAKKAAPSARKRRRSNRLRSADGKEARASSSAVSRHTDPDAPVLSAPVSAAPSHFAAPPPRMPQVPIALPAGAQLSAAAAAAAPPGSGASILEQFLAAGLDERSAYAATGIALGLLGPSSAPAPGAGAGGAAMLMPPPPGPQ